MLKVFLICVLMLFGLLLSTLKRNYSRVGKNEEFPAGVQPNNKRALHFIARNTSLVSIVLNSLTLLLVTASVVLLGIFLGFVGAVASYLFVLAALMAIPCMKNSKLSDKLAFWLAPYVRVIAEKVRPLQKRMEPLSRRFGGGQIDTGIYTNDDLVEFIGKQKNATNNSINQDELDDLVKRLEFGKKRIDDSMKPLKELKIVGSSEQIGPVLINELHETGQRYFLVEEEFDNDIVGTLGVAKLVGLQHSGDVKKAMDDKLYYLNKTGSLLEAIDAFFKTGSHVFIVVNKNQKIVGLLSIEDVIEKLIKVDEANDFDMFDSKEAVAKGEQWDEDES